MIKNLFDPTAIQVPNGPLEFITSILDSSTEYALIGKNLEGTIVVWNEGARRIYDYEPEEVLGRVSSEILHSPDDVALGRPREILDAALRSGKWEGTIDQVRKSGQRFKARLVVTPRRGADGDVSGYLQISKDISGEIHLAEELRAAQFYTRSLIELNIDGIIATDPLGVITDVNLLMCEMTGFDRDDLIGTPFRRYFTDPQRADDGISRVLAEDRVTNYELTMRAKDGRETIVSYNATTFRDERGRLQGVFAAARNITEQKRLEDDLREVQNYTRGLIEASVDPMITVDPTLTITDVNGQMVRLTEVQKDSLIGSRFDRYFTEPERAATGVERTLREGSVTDYELTLQTPSGREFLVSFNASIFRDTEGKVRGIFAVARDVTDQRRLEEQYQRVQTDQLRLEEQYRRVQEANRLKNEFMANMSHELRTPLNGIVGFAELMHDGKVGRVSSEQKEYLGDILTSSTHLLQLINDVLDLAKVESGKMDIRPEPIDLKKVVAETRDILRTLAAQKRIRVRLEIDPALTDVVADPAKLKQILYNYLSNALKFTPDEGQVAILVSNEGATRFRIAVVDSGIGIRAEDLGRLFVEFQQLDAGAAKKYQGTGLGLALTKRVVEAQGGFVGVSSVVGQGSTFFAVLPRIIESTRVESSGLALVPRPAFSSSGTILVVEDEPGDRAWLGRILSAAGYEVVFAATGAEAIRFARAQPFDTITLDLILPDVGGWDVLKELRRDGANQFTPIIIVTVVRDQSISIGYPIREIMTKPVEKPELLATLVRALDDGVHGQTVLVVDDDPTLLALMEVTLREAGYRAICVPTVEQGLLAAQEENPAVIVLGLFLPDTDGYSFLERYRLTEAARHVPVIILTSRDLSDDERSRLVGSAQSFVLKGADGEADLLDALRTFEQPLLDQIAPTH